MGIEAKINEYWIAPNAISITLNALGNANRIQGSVTSGSVISCYIESVKPESAGEAYAGNGDGLGLDNGRNPKRWLLTISPTYFNSNTAKYVYAAIPRRASFSTQAVIVFPSERIDIYGKNDGGEQIGSVDYFYVWLRGIISAPITKEGTLQRTWTQAITWGSLGTYEDIIDMSETDWYSFSKAMETVTFLKRIVMKAGSYFQNIFLGEKELTGVATAATDEEFIDSDTLVATPNFISRHYLRKDADDEATGLIRFAKGLWSRSIEVLEDVVIGGTLRVANAILTKTIQSINFGGDSQFGTGWQLTDNDGNGYSRLTVDNLFVRMKAVFNALEVRKFVAMGGNYVFSPAASIIEEVDYIHFTRDEQTGEVTGEEVLGYEYVKVPWVLRLIPMSLAGRFLSKKKQVRSSAADIDFSQVDVFRCWLKSDDGTTRTINTWSVGMLARCQTFDVSQGGGGNHSETYYDGDDQVTASGNKLYWRAVVAIGKALTKQTYTETTHILDDGLAHNYIDLANYTDENDVTLYQAGSDNPSALDHIVCYGNWQNESLSNIISIETVGSGAPAIREYLGLGYSDGTDIDWTTPMADKERTRISPIEGNKFVAPDFDIITVNGSVGLKESVEAAGLHINGENSSIDLIAGKVNFVDPDGEPYQTPKISIDPTTGTLHAVDGSFSGTINASAGTFAGTLSGATGTFSGQLSSVDNKVILTTSRTEAYGKWRGLAVINQEASAVEGDVATFGGRYYSDKSYGRIALAKRVVTSSGGSIIVNATIPITLDANDGSIEAISIEADEIAADEIEVDDAKVNTSLDITGIVTGLRLQVTTITTGSSYTPTLEDGIIIINSNQNFNLDLPQPDGNYIGKFYFIRNRSSYNLTVSCTNGSNIVQGNNGSSVQSDNITRPTTMCFSDGSNWIMMYSDY